MMTTLGRTTARCGELGRMVTKVGALAAARPTSVPFNPKTVLVRSLATTPMRLGQKFDYDYNLGWPGSRFKNPAPHLYDDVHPGQGKAWYALISLSTFCWFYGNYYDTS